jgi:hypothetical protein
MARAVAAIGPAAWAPGTATPLAARDPDMFQRFGPLGMAASVLFFTDRFPHVELARPLPVERRLHQYGLELEGMCAGIPAADIPGKGYVIDVLVGERISNRLRHTADRIRIANIGLLTVSTLQWGFGDLLLTHLPTGGA